MKNIKISVIIPYFNLQKELEVCLNSLSKQTFSKHYYEVVIVDDGSSKKPDKIIKKFQGKIKNIKKIKLNNRTIGPGIARNKGIKEALGTYVFFLDADDVLPVHSLKYLYNLILIKKADVVTFNWKYFNNSRKKIFKSMRKDCSYFTQNKEKFIKLFISMNFDTSVIFIMCKKRIFTKNKIFFPAGYHEDISVAFQVYLYSKKIFCEKRVMYLKSNREKSIVNTLSINHITGFFKSWVIIKKILIKNRGLKYFKKNLINYYIKGIAGLIAIMILKNIKFGRKNIIFRKKFYFLILDKVKKIFLLDLDINTFPQLTRYDKISYTFIKHFLIGKIKKKETLLFFERELYKKKLINHINAK